MRKPVQRALALAAAVPAVAASLVVSAPAAHAAIPGCGAGSTVLADFEVLGGNRTRVATYDAGSGQRYLCIQVLYYDQFTVLLKTEIDVTPPTVRQTPGTGTCQQRVLDVYQPVQLALSVGANTSGTPSLCVGKDGVTTTISVTGPSIQTLPDVDVWAAGDSWFTWLVVCAPEAVQAHVTGDNAAWVACRIQDRRLL